MRHLTGTLIFAVSLFLTLLTAGCADDMPGPGQQRNISFTASVSSSWSNLSGARSGAPKSDYSIRPATNMGGTDSIYLHTEVIDEFQYTPGAVPAGRSQLITSADDMYNRIGVSAYCYTGTFDATRDKPNYFYNNNAWRSGSNFLLSIPYMWPGEGQKMRFVAHAPLNDEVYAPAGIENHRVLPDGTCEYFPGLVVNMPTDVTKQQDLLVATTGDVNASEQPLVGLNFRHALTAVRFECGPDMLNCRIKKVTINPVLTNGVMDLNTCTVEPWNYGTYSQAVDVTVNGTTGQPITEGAQTFLMLPQTLVNWAYIEMEIETPTGPTVIQASIANTKWEAGKTVVYRVSFNNWWEKIELYQNGLELKDGIFFFNTHSPETQQVDIKSYRVATIYDVEHERRALPWKAEYSTDNGATWSATPPSWLTAAPQSGPGHATNPLTYNCTAAANSCIEIDLDAKLRANPMGGASARYNLAANEYSDVIKNTANTYVVPGYGYFKFPVVYGNGVKNGANNTSAYLGPNTGNTLPAFVNHLGTQMFSPYIKDYGNFVIQKAVLLRQDRPGLVTNVTYDATMYGGKGGIRFDVPSDVQQGNALIALLDTENRVIWSWQIWLTPLCKVEDAVPILNFVKYEMKISDATLGWVSRKPVRKYYTHKCKMRISGLGRTAIPGQTVREYVVLQVGFTDLTPGDAPLYQWGRKDPFTPGGGALQAAPGRYTTTLPQYDASGALLPMFTSKRLNTESEKKYSKTDIAQWRVANPTVFHDMTLREGIAGGLPDYSNVADELYINLWDSQRTTFVASDAHHVVSTDVNWDVTSTKSVYDPCPPGFKVTTAGSATGLTYTGTPADQPKWWQGIAAPSGEGFIFRSPIDLDKSICVGHCGYRDWIQYGQIYEFSTDGYYWSSGPSSTNYAVYTCFMFNRPNFPAGSAHINPTNNFVMGDGLSVRPMIDEAPIKHDSAPRRPFR